MYENSQEQQNTPCRDMLWPHRSHIIGWAPLTSQTDAQKNGNKTNEKFVEIHMNLTQTLLRLDRREDATQPSVGKNADNSTKMKVNVRYYKNFHPYWTNHNKQNAHQLFQIRKIAISTPNTSAVDSPLDIQTIHEVGKTTQSYQLVKKNKANSILKTKQESSR